jgi:TonB family protein
MRISFGHALGCLAATVGAGSGARAQNGLYVEHGTAFSLVRSAVRNQPYVEENGKLVPASGSRYGLKKVDEYAPYFISIRELRVSTSQVNIVGTGAELNKTFQFKAQFESPFLLENTFVVLDLNSADAGKALFLWEIGTLRPRELKDVTLFIPMTVSVGEGKYKIHLFSNGYEVFHSKMPWTFVENTLDKMVARRVKDAPDGLPKPFVGPGPEYPAKLRRAKTKGEAVINFVVSRNGRVLEPTILSATDPAFGEAALVAARQWRFLPRIVNGAPVETKVNFPFTFTP